MQGGRERWGQITRERWGSERKSHREWGKAVMEYGITRCTYTCSRVAALLEDNSCVVIKKRAMEWHRDEEERTKHRLSGAQIKERHTCIINTGILQPIKYLQGPFPSTPWWWREAAQGLSDAGAAGRRQGVGDEGLNINRHRYPFLSLVWSH